MQQKYKFQILLSFSFFFFTNYHAQSFLKAKLTNEQIEKKIDNSNTDPSERWKLINFYLAKSKKELNFEALFYGYRYASIASGYPQNIKYADSALISAKKSKVKKTILDAYLNRGNINMTQEFYEKALDDILVANSLSQESGNDYIFNKTIYYIAQNKIYLGQYEDANKELLICLKFFKDNLRNTSSLGKNYQVYYIYSLMSLIDSNTKLGQHQYNQVLLKEAFDYLKNNKLDQYIPYFITSEGLSAYYSKDYDTAISKLSEAIRLYNDQWQHNTEVYYLGLSYWHTGKQKLAVKYLEEIDRHYNQTKKLDPQFRSAYEILIKYYKSTSNTAKQLEYIDKLMFLDKSYEKNYKYLYKRIVKEYDTNKLVAEKNQIQSKLNNQRIIFAAIFLFFLIAFTLFGLKIQREKQNYKKRFEEILAQKDLIDLKETEKEEGEKEKKEVDTTDYNDQQKFDYDFYNKIPGLNPIFVENILQQLDIFEKENKFLESQISQKSVSEKLGTNSTYFSKIINTYKGKNFALYISDLRLDYIIYHLKNDVKYINKDVKELATIAGFSSTENFSDNFRRKFDLKPSVFIKMMKEKL